MNWEVLINIGIMMLVVLIYFLFRNWQKNNREYQELYAKIVNSQEHKVKGQYD